MHCERPLKALSSAARPQNPASKIRQRQGRSTGFLRTLRPFPDRRDCRPHCRTAAGEPNDPGPIAPTLLIEGPQGEGGGQNKLGPDLSAHPSGKMDVSQIHR